MPRSSIARRLLHRERIRQGLCYRCGKNPPIGGPKKIKYCATCSESLDKRYAKTCADLKMKYDERLAAGVCPYCGGKLAAGDNRICKACCTRQGDRTRAYNLRLKLRVIKAYGGKCACCGESNVGFLTLGHIHNDGASHRRAIKRPGGSPFYLWLEQRGYPKDQVQLECWNCNVGKKDNRGICPHEKLFNSDRRVLLADVTVQERPNRALDLKLAERLT